MRTRLISLMLAALAAHAGPAAELSLKQAVERALKAHPALEAAEARRQAAEARVAQAQGARLPQVQYTEMFQSGTNPVYVFGSLLTQRQFTASNFALDALNRPAPLNNFQSQVVADQLVYDFGGVKNMVKAARLGRAVSEAEKKAAEQALIAGVARAYHGVTVTTAALEVAREGQKSAEADLGRARTLREAGMATEADVLAAQVQVAALGEQVIRQEANLSVARAALNQAMGQGLDELYELTTPLTAARAEEAKAYVRPELVRVQLMQEMAQAQAATARSRLLPQVFLRGVLEADRQNFVTRGGGNWMFAGGLKWTLFDGARSKAAVAEAKAQAAAAGAGERELRSGIELEKKKAQAELASANGRLGLTEATIAQAEESLRILRNRYTNGLATITDVLRAQTAALEARLRRLGALYDQRLAALAVAQASGELSAEAKVLE